MLIDGERLPLPPVGQETRLLFNAFDSATLDAVADESFRLSTPIMSRHKWLDRLTDGDGGGVRLLLNLSILFATISDFPQTIVRIRETFYFNWQPFCAAAINKQKSFRIDVPQCKCLI
jgi:hypothetical protein